MTTMKTSLMLAALLLCSAAVAADPLTITPTSAAISGFAGSTIGWGFTLTNNDNTNTYYVVPFGSDFCPGAISSPCDTGIGAYTDIISGSVFEVAPGDTVTQNFDNSIPTGWGSITLDSNLAPQTVTGTLVLYYGVYVGDFTNGNQVGGTDEFDFAGASVTVESPIPEPASLLLLASGLGALLSRRKSAARA
jgi:hypothetical protein